MDSNVASFLNYIKHERNFSDYTLKNYKEDLKQYEDFIVAKAGFFDPLSLEVDYVRAWMADMAKRGLKVTTIKRRLCEKLL